MPEITVRDFRDSWRERMRQAEIKRREKYLARKPRKVTVETERMPWPEDLKITQDEVWRKRE